MTRIVVVATLALVASLAAPAYARDFVQDGAGMFSKGAIAQVDQRIATFNQATGKEVVVVTVPSLNGAALQDAAAKTFSEQNVNGVLIFIARDDRRDIIVPDRSGAQAGWFTPDVLRSIRSQMEHEFHNEAFDSGLLFGVDGVLQVYGQHMQARSAPGPALAPSRPNAAGAAPRLPSTSGVHISMFWWIIIVVVGFLILRSVMRAFSTPRYGPPGAMPPAGSGPGYGPGYGGYGGYGGGGSFWSGLLGGLGGAWLGNEMFGNRGGGAIAPADAAQNVTPDSGGGWGGDSGGWQSDAGQADMGGASSGDWSGGGFGDSGGGDFGGGDFGGGGGDSGGGW